MVEYAEMAELTLAELLIHDDKDVRELAERIAEKLIIKVDEKVEVNSRVKYKQ